MEQEVVVEVVEGDVLEDTSIVRGTLPDSLADLNFKQTIKFQISIRNVGRALKHNPLGI